MSDLEKMLQGKSIKMLTTVHDYTQILFSDESVLNIYNKFSNSLSDYEEKNNTILSCYESDKKYFINFNDGQKIVISLLDIDFSGPEAFAYYPIDGNPIIWN